MKPGEKTVEISESGTNEQAHSSPLAFIKIILPILGTGLEIWEARDLVNYIDPCTQLLFISSSTKDER